MNSSSLDRLMSDTNNEKPQSETISPSNPWITSGKIGTRDAVLVFRISALNKSIGDDYDDIDDDNDVDDDDDDDDGDDNDDDDDENNDNNNNGNVGVKINMPPSNTTKSTKPINVTKVNVKNIKYNKVLATLPKNINRMPSSTSAAMPSSTSAASLNNGKLPLVFEKGLKKRAHDSLSSSENSISSTCDDPTDIENDIINASENYSSTTAAKIQSVTSVAQQKRTDFKLEVNSSVGKENLSINNNQYCDTSEMPAKILKITYKFMNTETKLLKKILASHGLIEINDNQNFNLLWTGIHMKPDVLRNLTPYQRVNHFPRSYELTRKDRLYKNIEKMQHLRGFKHFDIVPLSFMLPLEYRDLLSAHRSGHRGPWIVKPAASSRGRGIFLVNTPEQISLDEQVIVSKYIANPLCIDGHKCDVRLYVAVTSFDPLLIYMYEEGLVRLATVKYERNVENLWNPCMHLCNYSINKYHSDYIKATESFEDVGHKWTFSALLRHLKSQNCDIKELMINIEDVIIKSIFASAQSIVSACRMFVPNTNNCFELYGFDILIDDTLKPWLLETNLSPSLGIDTPLDVKVKASLLTDLLTLTGIPAITPLARATYDNKWQRFKGNAAANSSCNNNTLNTRGSKNLPSAETLTQSGVGKIKSNSSSSSSSSSSSLSLSHEEIKIVKNARAQYERRGGFVRIYPCVDSIQKYGMFLDTITGIPISTMSAAGSTPCSMIIPHNYNQMLYTQLFTNFNGNGGGGGAGLTTTKQSSLLSDNNIDNRMERYERTLLITNQPLKLEYKNLTSIPKCIDEAHRLRKQIRKLIENGNELSQLQSRKAFSLYLEYVLKRLTHDPPKGQHEKLILKFITRSSGMTNIKPPSFMKTMLQSSVNLSSTSSLKILSKDRSAIVAKLLGDYLELYNRDTESYEDTFDRYGMIPIRLFNDFLLQAQESDLESVLTLHTNLTKQMPFLYNPCAIGVPVTPPIPTGLNGFLKALPNMAPNIGYKDLAKIDNYYKAISSTSNGGVGGGSTTTTTTTTSTNASTSSNNEQMIKYEIKCDKNVNIQKSSMKMMKKRAL